MSHMLEPLKAVTHNLPGVLRQPLIAIIGKECYTSLVWNIDLSDIECLKYSASKVLGIGLVAGGVFRFHAGHLLKRHNTRQVLIMILLIAGGIVKLPQLYKIINSKSIRGVSLTSYLLDTASQLIAVAYNIRQHFPFNTYGESAFLTIQNVLIILMIFAYSHQSSKAAKALTFLAITGASTQALLSSDIVPIGALRSLLALSIPLSLSSKIPQIATIASSSTTGQLSAFTVFSSLLGTLARVFTTATETGDKTLWWSYVLASVLNGVIALQMLWYWKTPSEPAAAKVHEKIQEARKLAQPVPANPIQGTIPVGATPVKPVHAGNGVPKSVARSAPRSASSRYTRKVD